MVLGACSLLLVSRCLMLAACYLLFLTWFLLLVTCMVLSACSLLLVTCCLVLVAYYLLVLHNSLTLTDIILLSCINMNREMRVLSQTVVRHQQDVIRRNELQGEQLQPSKKKPEPFKEIADDLLDDGWINITGTTLQRRTTLPVLFSEPIRTKFPRNKNSMKGILQTLLPEDVLLGVYKGMCDVREQKIADGMYKNVAGKVLTKYRKPSFAQFFIYLAMLLYSGIQKILFVD